MKTLDDAAIFLSGGTPKKGNPDFWGGEIPWYSASNMNSRFLKNGEPRITEAGLRNGSRIAPKGATLLLVRGSGLFNYIPICYADQDVAFNQDVKALCPKDNTDPVFLHFWLENKRQELKNNLGVTGIGAGKFDTDYLKKIPFPDFSKNKQHEIGKLTESFDRKIELNRQMNETLEEMARSTFKSWFVDFDPVVAKAAGQAPAHMSADTAALFPTAFNEDGLPDGWNKGVVADFCSLNANSWKQKDAPAEVYYVDLANTKNGEIQSIQYYLWNDAPSRARRVLKDGDTLVGTVRPGNRSFTLIGPSDKQLTASTGFAVLSPTIEANREFVYCASTSNEAIDRLAQLADGGAYPAVRPEVVSQIECVIPTDDVRIAFHEFTKPLFDKYLANHDQNQTLADLRDTLLPKLMSGEIRLRDAEKAVEENL